MGALTDLDAWLPLVVPEVPTCPEPTALAAVRRALRDFCAYTYAWQETSDPATALAGQAVYDVESPLPQARVLAIFNLRHRGQLVTPQTEAELDRCGSNWRTVTALQVRHFVHESFASVRLYPIPNLTEVLSLTDLRVALQPTVTATSVDAMLLDEYGEGIAFGALEYLLRMPGRVWSNPQLANFHRSQYVKEKSRVRRLARAGFAPNEAVAHYKLAGAP